MFFFYIHEGKMTRLVIYIISLSTLVACDDENSCYHNIPHEYYILPGEIKKENGFSLSSIECDSELSGFGDEMLEVSYFYTRKCKDSILWEEGIVKLPIKNR